MKNNKGMTLVELMVTFAVSLIAIAMIAVVIVSSMNIAGKTVFIDSRSQLASDVFDIIRKQLTEATDISFTGASGTDNFSVVDGRFYINGEKVYDDDVYGESNIKIEISGFGDVINLTVSILDKEESLYSESMDFKILNSKLYGDSEEDFMIYYTPFDLEQY